MDGIVNLKRFRQVFNLTQAKAAESIGIDQRQWNRYENGYNEMPVLGVVELDDLSHDEPDRKLRDQFVDEILLDVGYTVIHTRYVNENTLDPIIDRL